MSEGKGFLILCDKHLENDVGVIVGKLNDGSGEIIIKTIDDISGTRGNNFTEQFQRLLDWAHGVVFVTSENFAAFMDKKKKDDLPQILKDKHKESRSVLENFIKTQPSKLLSISVNGDKSLPKVLSGKVEILEQDKGKEHLFIESLKGMIADKISK